MPNETYLAGLLANPRNCPHGHGAMTEAPGLFAIPQVEYLTPNPVDQAAGGRTLRNTSQLYVVKIFVCKKCGSLELVDSDKA